VRVKCCLSLLHKMVKVLQEIFRNDIKLYKDRCLGKGNKGRHRLEYIERNISWKYLIVCVFIVCVITLRRVYMTQ
jgi:hypothetical protein